MFNETKLNVAVAASQFSAGSALGSIAAYPTPALTANNLALAGVASVSSPAATAGLGSIAWCLQPNLANTNNLTVAGLASASQLSAGSALGSVAAYPTPALTANNLALAGVASVSSPAATAGLGSIAWCLQPNLANTNNLTVAGLASAPQLSAGSALGSIAAYPTSGLTTNSLAFTGVGSPSSPAPAGLGSIASSLFPNSAAINNLSIAGPTGVSHFSADNSLGRIATYPASAPKVNDLALGVVATVSSLGSIAGLPSTPACLPPSSAATNNMSIAGLTGASQFLANNYMGIIAAFPTAAIELNSVAVISAAGGSPLALTTGLGSIAACLPSNFANTNNLVAPNSTALSCLDANINSGSMLTYSSPAWEKKRNSAFAENIDESNFPTIPGSYKSDMFGQYAHNVDRPIHRDSTYEHRLLVSGMIFEFMSAPVPEVLEGDDFGASFDPTSHALLTSIEQHLRLHIETKLTALKGSNWIDVSLSEHERQDWKNLQGLARSKKRVVYKPIQYSYMMQLCHIICEKSNWNLIFREIFRDKLSFEKLMQRIHLARIEDAHSRPLNNEMRITLIEDANTLFRTIGIKVRLTKHCVH